MCSLHSFNDLDCRDQFKGWIDLRELDCWMRTLTKPWTVAMEATIFSGWIYDHLLPHAAQIKVAHPLLLCAIAVAKKKNDQIDDREIADCLRCDFLPECHMMPAVDCLLAA